MTSNVLENLSKMVRTSSQSTPKIDLEGGLEAAWEPPLCRGDLKTSFLTILAPLGDPIWGPVLAYFGHCFLMLFLICLLDGIVGDLGSFGPYYWGFFWDVFGSLFESLRKL